MCLPSSLWLAHKVGQMLEDTDTRLAVHEALCSERYKRIDESLSVGDKRMAKIEYLIYAVMLCVLLGPGVAADFVKKLLGL
jgi:hypothetical protein